MISRIATVINNIATSTVEPSKVRGNRARVEKRYEFIILSMETLRFGLLKKKRDRKIEEIKFHRGVKVESHGRKKNYKLKKKRNEGMHVRIEKLRDLITRY